MYIAGARARVCVYLTKTFLMYIEAPFIKEERKKIFDEKSADELFITTIFMQNAYAIFMNARASERARFIYNNILGTLTAATVIF